MSARYCFRSGHGARGHQAFRLPLKSEEDASGEGCAPGIGYRECLYEGIQEVRYWRTEGPQQGEEPDAGALVLAAQQHPHQANDGFAATKILRKVEIVLMLLGSNSRFTPARSLALRSAACAERASSVPPGGTEAAPRRTGTLAPPHSSQGVPEVHTLQASHGASSDLRSDLHSRRAQGGATCLR